MLFDNIYAPDHFIVGMLFCYVGRKGFSAPVKSLHRTFTEPPFSCYSVRISVILLEDATVELPEFYYLRTPAMLDVHVSELTPDGVRTPYTVVRFDEIGR